MRPHAPDEVIRRSNSTKRCLTLLILWREEQWEKRITRTVQIGRNCWELEINECHVNVNIAETKSNEWDARGSNRLNLSRLAGSAKNRSKNLEE
jgi:hypothetical protein